MSRPTKLAGTKALVTGANRGIGKAIVVALLEAGADKVYAGARDTASLSDLAGRFGARLVPVKLDVTSDADAAAAARSAGDVNLLINNAGLASFVTGLADGDLTTAQREMDVNYFGVIRMVHAFAPVLKKNGGGAVVTIASIVSMVNFPSANTYCATKAAVWSLMQGFRAVLANQGTRVMTVHPGPIDTDMAAQLTLDKVPPSAVAAELIEGLLSGAKEVYPDPFARHWIAEWTKDRHEVETQMAQGVAAH
jgi:NAD(P)-dependent dehydrogenase (short-subunit alcohol dehydrogenase family)